MLALFSPKGWRDPKNLKTEDESWDEAFLRTTFEPRTRVMMKNMNMLYEYYEASHDFSALRRKEQHTLMIEDMEKLSCGYGDDTNEDEGDNANVLESLSRDAGQVQPKYINTMELFKQTSDEIKVNSQKQADLSIQEFHGVHESLLKEVRQSRTPAGGWKAALKAANKQRITDTRNRTNLSSHEVSTAFSIKKCSGNLHGKVTIATKHTLDPDHGSHDFVFEKDTCPYEERIIIDFVLNEEQERAFRIICMHLRLDTKKLDNSTLRMYLGGIGGTGKSEVIKAVITYLEARNEGHRYIVLAPTGSAACLVDGSTYHSALGLNTRTNTSNAKAQGELKDKFAFIDVIFVDEVSMLSCEDMFRITHHLSEAFHTDIESFGGKHVVLAGDFGQLKPAGKFATPLYSNSVPLHVLALDERGLMRALGKAVWHHFTTVVILRENMRQCGMSDEDKKYRTCLENMRYGRCTQEDIELLNSRIMNPEGPSIHEKRFKDVSVITPLNGQRDAWNATGVQRFAAETGQSLHRFHSIDTCSQKSRSTSVVQDLKDQKTRLRTESNTNLLPFAAQKRLWNLTPALTDHVAGTLDICIGMPVLLKHNEATELCATNGAEATIIDWTAQSNPHGSQSLKTLFVKLKNPPRSMKLDSLPENVIPLTLSPHPVICTLPEGRVSISRSQISVLPNFAMTDYGAQGRTRPCNPVDLRTCRGHQSAYTCLSRSSSLEGTLILYPFRTEKITSGATGDLRREYKDLEILDDITRMRCDISRPQSMPPNNSYRNVMILWYQKTFGKRHLPQRAHFALQRRERVDDAFDTPSKCVAVKDMVDKLTPILERKKTGKKHSEAPDKNLPSKSSRNRPNGKQLRSISAKLTFGRKRKPAESTTRANPRNPYQPPPNTGVSKHSPVHQEVVGTKGKRKLQDNALPLGDRKRHCGVARLRNIHPSQKTGKANNGRFSSASWLRNERHVTPIPMGLLWDATNWSCAYDALLGPLWNLYMFKPSLWRNRLKNQSTHLAFLLEQFQSLNSIDPDLEHVRRLLRLRLPSNVVRFGATPTDLTSVVYELFTHSSPFATLHAECTFCGEQRTPRELHHGSWIATPGIASTMPNQDHIPLSDLVQATLSEFCKHRRCHQCFQWDMTTNLTWNTTMPLFILELQPHPNKWRNLVITTRETISLPGTSDTYKLISIVYLGMEHFTCRFIDTNDNMWCHDGISQNRFMTAEPQGTSLVHLEERAPCLLLFQLCNKDA